MYFYLVVYLDCCGDVIPMIGSIVLLLFHIFFLYLMLRNPELVLAHCHQGCCIRKNAINYPRFGIEKTLTTLEKNKTNTYRLNVETEFSLGLLGASLAQS